MLTPRGRDGMPQKGVKVVAQNRRARHDYFVLETWEAGIELRGTEAVSYTHLICSTLVNKRRDMPQRGEGEFRGSGKTF